MADFNIADLFNRNILGARGGGEEGGAKRYDPNTDETPQIIVDGVNSLPSKAAKIMEAIPIIGPLLSRFIPLNIGEVGLLADRKGILDKQINEGAASLGARGGPIYNATLGAIAKNRAVSDHTGGVGGSDQIASVSIEGLPVGGDRFDWSDMPMVALGNLVPSYSGGSGPVISGGMDIA